MPFENPAHISRHVTPLLKSNLHRKSIDLTFPAFVKQRFQHHSHDCGHLLLFPLLKTLSFRVRSISAGLPSRDNGRRSFPGLSATTSLSMKAGRWGGKFPRHWYILCLFPSFSSHPEDEKQPETNFGIKTEIFNLLKQLNATGYFKLSLIPRSSSGPLNYSGISSTVPATTGDYHGNVKINRQMKCQKDLMPLDLTQLYPNIQFAYQCYK